MNRRTLYKWNVKIDSGNRMKHINEVLKSSCHVVGKRKRKRKVTV